MTKPIQLFSEIGRLKTVMMHRPGVELENLMPDYLDRFLFDDIPFLQQAQKEHDFFADTLRKNDVQVLYLEDLVAETLVSSEAKEMFLNSYLDEAMIQEDFMRKEVFDFFMSIKDPRVLIDHTMAGLKKNELTIPPRLNLTSLTSLVEESYPFLIDPMPNLYFTRDPFATIGNSVSMNRMYAPTRRRETLYGNQIFHHHPLFAENQTNFLYHRDDTTRIEGGDQLILSDKLVAIGISQRTEVASIEKIAQTIFDTEPSFEHILAFNIGEERKFMHLDTVFTMVDVDKFTIHPEIEGELSVYSISKHQGGVQIFEERDTLENILCRYLDLPEVALIRCGGDDLTAAAREQWNDGSNTLAIAPGEVVVYDRNIVTNQLLKSAGVKLNEVPGSELVRGRGGPRCMSMPFVREV